MQTRHRKDRQDSALAQVAAATADAGLDAAGAAAELDAESAGQAEGGTLATDNYDQLHGFADTFMGGVPAKLQGAYDELDGLHDKMLKKDLFATIDKVKKTFDAQLQELKKTEAEQAASGESEDALPQSIGRGTDLNSDERIAAIIATRKANAEKAADNKHLQGTEREAFIASEMARVLAKQVATNGAKATEEAAKHAAVAEKHAALQKEADELKAKHEAAEIERKRQEAEDQARTRQQLKVLTEQKQAAEKKAKEQAQLLKEQKQAAKSPAKSPAGADLPQSKGRGTKRYANRDAKVADLGLAKVMQQEAVTANRRATQEKRIIDEYLSKQTTGCNEQTLATVRKALETTLGHMRKQATKLQDEVAANELLKRQLGAARAGKKAMQDAAADVGLSEERINDINTAHAEPQSPVEGSSSNA